MLCFVFSMPYKVVQTIEGGKICLSVVPSNWEKEGTLSWPKRSEASSMLDETSVPGKNWSTYACILKRTCSTYKTAGLAVKSMENVTDTDEEVPTRAIQRPQENHAVLDLNHLMEVEGDSTAVVSPITVTISDNAMADRISLTDVNASFLLKADNDEVIKNQLKILEVLEELQNTQKKILQQLAKHEVQFMELSNKMAECSVATTARKNCEGSAVEEHFPPLKTVEELYKLEENLKDVEFRTKYFKMMSSLCSPGLGAKGTNICYKIVDYFFSRELLTLVSWSGNSRDQNEKIAFKFFAHTRQMIFSIIHNADSTISQLETDNFMRAIIKNSRQRFQATIKPVSASTPTSRKKRTNNNSSKSLSDAAESHTERAADVEVEQPLVNVDEPNSADEVVEAAALASTSGDAAARA
ncbi:uncharacterized protein LOC125489538 [Plutella xylostella]|uniref:uncharacterized protein LOC125489538 n=1 Tax=Plutella xylostella TaxID=51655 RepID=UPI002032493E|nr:uncharacterized protein LOC125489538 [Plutella xylostella]